MRTTLCLVVLAALVIPAWPAHAADPGEGIQVAVLDTGVDASHPELTGRVDRMSFYKPTIPNIPGLPDPGTLQPDPDGHGTAVASVVAGKTVGTAPGARILDLQVSARYTQGALDPTQEDAANRAMDWLLQHHGGNGTAGPRVAVLSFAENVTPDGANTLAAQAESLWREGVLVLVPQGAPPAQSPLHRSPYVVTVGDQDATCAASQPPINAPLKPDVSGPARNVKVAKPGNAAQPGTTGTASGKPLAAAMVAGVAARMWQARPGLPVSAMQAILRDVAADRAAQGPDACTGFGAVQTDPAVTAAQAWTDPVPADAVQNKTPGPATAVVAVAILGLAAGLRRRTR